MASYQKPVVLYTLANKMFLDQLDFSISLIMLTLMMLFCGLCVSYMLFTLVSMQLFTKLYFGLKSARHV